MNLPGLATACILMVIPLPAVARQEAPRAISIEEDALFAARESRHPGAAAFEAGDALGALISILLIVALVSLIWYLLVEAGS